MPKKEATVGCCCKKLCFFTAGTLLFSSDGTVFDRLLYKMFRKEIAFLKNLVNVDNNIMLRTYYQTLIMVIRVTKQLCPIPEAHLEPPIGLILVFR